MTICCLRDCEERRQKKPSQSGGNFLSALHKLEMPGRKEVALPPSFPSKRRRSSRCCSRSGDGREKEERDGSSRLKEEGLFLLRRSNSLRSCLAPSFLLSFFHPFGDLRLSAADDSGRRRPTRPSSLPSLSFFCPPPPCSLLRPSPSMTSFGGDNATATIAVQDLFVFEHLRMRGRTWPLSCLPPSHHKWQNREISRVVADLRITSSLAVAQLS